MGGQLHILIFAGKNRSFGDKKFDFFAVEFAGVGGWFLNIFYWWHW
jgi:hypothetical protein